MFDQTCIIWSSVARFETETRYGSGCFTSILQRKEVILMVTYEGLFAFCMLIVCIVELVWKISNNNRK